MLSLARLKYLIIVNNILTQLNTYIPNIVEKTNPAYIYLEHPNIVPETKTTPEGTSSTARPHPLKYKLCKLIDKNSS